MGKGMGKGRGKGRGKGGAIITFVDPDNVCCTFCFLLIFAVIALACLDCFKVSLGHRHLCANTVIRTCICVCTRVRLCACSCATVCMCHANLVLTVLLHLRPTPLSYPPNLLHHTIPLVRIRS